MEDVVRVLRNTTAAQEIVDRAYHEVALNPANSFAALVQRVDRVMAEDYATAERRGGYSEAEFEWRLGPARHDLTRYATIVTPTTGSGSSRPLLRKPNETPASVPAMPGPPPHRLTMVLSPPLKIFAVHLVWSDAMAAANGGVVIAYRGRHSVRRVRVGTDRPRRYVRIELPAVRRIDRLEFSFDSFHQGDELRLDDIRIDGEVHITERLRQSRERVGEALATRFKWMISDLWMSLPEPVRRLTKHPVRALYNLITGHRG
jgi:hypothetical protein